MLLLCKLNKISIEYSQSELVKLGLEVASNIADETYILDWTKKHNNKKDVPWGHLFYL
ncbi:hypothetical protein [Clostridioides difficile]|uniref:hypothetical protein n=1 Tax=Clostridioides difficile TaxID=1496 RepID=UPI001C16457D|nr:hypothetical protein [Clostridioides difficile]MCP8664510.1 hypothetical protein [Clostridioides difficile]MDV9368783.1 hypothetical protein [Clostridioides difficile]HBF7930105.1 hypothetical protein [Clostridioides difficile]